MMSQLEKSASGRNFVISACCPNTVFKSHKQEAQPESVTAGVICMVCLRFTLNHQNIFAENIFII
ncbi:MAG: hypothetical protein K2Q11_05180 [Burkholderiaceae bacterium]|nr:hypothetical protein [Burkholderiaceae bacterium]